MLQKLRSYGAFYLALSAIACADGSTRTPLSPAVIDTARPSPSVAETDPIRQIAIDTSSVETIAARTFTISGSVIEKVYPSWSVSRATIRVSRGPSATTDARGKYSLKLPAGSYTLTISANGYKPTTIKKTISGSTSLNLQLPITVPRGASARCKDRTWSSSNTRSGTCSHHKGVAYWVCPGRLCK